MVSRPIIAIIAPNPYIVTDITMHLEGAIKADLVYAYNVEDGAKICKEKKPEIVVIYSSVFGREKFDLDAINSSKKVIIIAPLDSFAKMNVDMKRVIEVFEKPINIITLENTIKKNLPKN